MAFYRHLTIDGMRIFYREAGDAGAPVLLVLHGFPASSFMFRDLIARLSGRFRIVAPDYPGFGYSDAPKAEGATYSFDFLADIMNRFVEKLELNKYAAPDWDAPVLSRGALTTTLLPEIDTEKPN